jgi:hypothetical protein
MMRSIIFIFVYIYFGSAIVTKSSSEINLNSMDEATEIIEQEGGNNIVILVLKIN